MNYKRIKAACQEFGICRNTMMRFANEAGAISRMGRIVFVDCELLNAFLSNQSATRGDES